MHAPHTSDGGDGGEISPELGDLVELEARSTGSHRGVTEMGQLASASLLGLVMCGLKAAQKAHAATPMSTSTRRLDASFCRVQAERTGALSGVPVRAGSCVAWAVVSQETRAADISGCRENTWLTRGFWLTLGLKLGYWLHVLHLHVPVSK